MYPSSRSQLTYETQGAVYFFSGAFDTLNNFSAHTVQIWGITFQTAEHAYQWKKFESTDPKLAEKIKSAGSPWLAKKLSKSSIHRRKDWNEVKVGIMLQIIAAKVKQHEDVQEILLATGNKQIVENSPVDSFWGCGADAEGENRMGKILMSVRDSFRQK